MNNVFKNFIDNQIINHPILYLKTDYKKSEISVLDQIFFTVGNGFEWKDGYPLLPSGNKNLVKYHKVDIEWFFKNRKKIWVLDFNEETLEFLKRFSFNPMEHYSNGNCWYMMDKDIINDYNAEVDKELAKNPDGDPFDFLNGIRKFERVVDFFAGNKISFYPISKHSKICQIFQQKTIQPETLYYAMKTLKYASNFYSENKSEDSEAELEKINNLMNQIQK